MRAFRLECQRPSLPARRQVVPGAPKTPADRPRCPARFLQTSRRRPRAAQRRPGTRPLHRALCRPGPRRQRRAQPQAGAWAAARPSMGSSNPTPVAWGVGGTALARRPSRQFGVWVRVAEELTPRSRPPDARRPEPCRWDVMTATRHRSHPSEHRAQPDPSTVPGDRAVNFRSQASVPPERWRPRRRPRGASRNRPRTGRRTRAQEGAPRPPSPRPSGTRTTARACAGRANSAQTGRVRCAMHRLSQGVPPPLVAPPAWATCP